MKRILFFLLTFIPPRPCFAQETGQAPDFLAAIFRMFWVLALVLAIIFVCIHFLKKMNLTKTGLFGSNRLMNIVETLHLGPKNSIAAIKAGEAYLLVGISGNQINYLTKLDISDEMLTQIEQKTGSHKTVTDNRPSTVPQKSVILLTESIKDKLTSRKSNRLKKSA